MNHKGSVTAKGIDWVIAVRETKASETATQRVEEAAEKLF
jgi:hypothetical protein